MRRSRWSRRIRAARGQCASDMKSVKDLIAKAKAQPGKLNCGAGTISTKLTGYLFNDKAGIDTVLLPYNGSSEVAHGVLTRSVDFGFDGPSAELPLIQSGDLRALAKLDTRAVSGPARSADARRRGGRASRRSYGLARPCRAPWHAARRSSTSFRARPRKSSTIPRSRPAPTPSGFILVKHARRIRRLYQERGGALAAGGEEKRSAFRLRHSSMKRPASLHIRGDEQYRYFLAVPSRPAGPCRTAW